MILRRSIVVRDGAVAKRSEVVCDLDNAWMTVVKIKLCMQPLPFCCEEAHNGVLLHNCSYSVVCVAVAALAHLPVCLRNQPKLAAPLSCMTIDTQIACSKILYCFAFAATPSKTCLPSYMHACLLACLANQSELQLYNHEHTSLSCNCPPQ